MIKMDIIKEFGEKFSVLLSSFDKKSYTLNATIKIV